MPLPLSLLAAVDAHRCLSGVYGHERTVHTCTDPTQPLVEVIQLSCRDCLSFRVGARADLLPPRMTEYELALAVSAHVQATRGYAWAWSGYTAAGSGFWLTVVAFGSGVHLVDTSRNRAGPGAIHYLVEGYRRGVITPADPGMLDPASYSEETVYFDPLAPRNPIHGKQDLLAAPGISSTPQPGLARANLVAYLPAAATSSHAAASGDAATSRLPLSIGDTCPRCGAEVRARQLFTGSFVGCLC